MFWVKSTKAQTRVFTHTYHLGGSPVSPKIFTHQEHWTLYSVRKDRVSATLVEQLISAFFSLICNCSLTSTSVNTGCKDLMTCLARASGHKTIHVDFITSNRLNYLWLKHISCWFNHPLKKKYSVFGTFSCWFRHPLSYPLFWLDLADLILLKLSIVLLLYSVVWLTNWALIFPYTYFISHCQA